MSALTRRLWRIVKASKGQFLAVAAVMMVGIGVYVSMSTAFNNLSLSQSTFYRDHDFADYYFQVVRAPEQVTERVASVPGVGRVTGRIQKDANLFLPDGRKVLVRLTAYPLPVQGHVNRLKLVSGRMFEAEPEAGGFEALVDPQFARANALLPGTTVHLIAGGRQVPLTITGTAISPEFVYVIKDPSTLMPDPENFGVVMMPLGQVQTVLGQPGVINQILVRLAPGANGEEVEKQVRAVLEPYGMLSSYPRKKQLSHAILQAELDQLKSSSRILPVMFLVVAAAVQMLILGRMVRAQRTAIGTMKAMGYTDREIVLHYTGYALLVAATGAACGCLLGLALASSISGAYAQYFNLPRAIGGLNTAAMLQGAISSILVGGAAGIIGARGVTGIHPAAAMRPEPPGRGKPVFLERFPPLWERLRPQWKLAIRKVLRRKGRLATEASGVMVATGLLVVAFFFNDSLDYLLKKHFQQDIKYDYLVRLAGPVRDGEVLYFDRLPGVIRVEPLLEFPVKVHYREKTEEDLVVGLPPDATLRVVAGENDRPLVIPQEGVLLNFRTAEKLGVKVGDEVEIETVLEVAPSRRSTVKVVGLCRQLIGGSSYMSLEAAGEVLGEKNLVSGAMLKVDPGYFTEVEEKLKGLNAVISVTSRQKELEGFYRNMGALIYFTAMMTGFALILGFTIVYSFTTVSLAERTAELGLLKALGFYSGEIAGVIGRETIIRALGGIILGLPFGKLMADLYLKSAGTTDMYTMPVVVYPSTYLWAAVGGTAFVLLAYTAGVRRLREIDPVEAMKNRD